MSTGDKGVIACFDVRGLADLDSGDPNQGSGAGGLLGMVPKWGQRHLDMFAVGDSEHVLTKEPEGKIQMWCAARQFSGGATISLPPGGRLAARQKYFNLTFHQTEP